MKKNKTYITTTEAIEISGVTKPTIINWCVKYGIGKKVVGRWRIDPVKLIKLLDEDEESKIK